MENRMKFKTKILKEFVLHKHKVNEEKCLGLSYNKEKKPA